MMAVRNDNINITIRRLRAERDRLRQRIEIAASDDLVRRHDQVEDQLIGALWERRRREREAVAA